MIDTQSTRLKQMLDDHRRHLQRNLSMRLREVRANNGYDGKLVEAMDAAEASDSDLQRDFGITIAEMTAEALRRVDQSLARLATGAYGSCAECDVKISLKRLTALPFALRCRECEELREIGKRRPPRLSAESSNTLRRYDADAPDENRCGDDSRGRPVP